MTAKGLATPLLQETDTCPATELQDHVVGRPIVTDHVQDPHLAWTAGEATDQDLLHVDMSPGVMPTLHGIVELDHHHLIARLEITFQQMTDMTVAEPGHLQKP